MVPCLGFLWIWIRVYGTEPPKELQMGVQIGWVRPAVPRRLHPGAASAPEPGTVSASGVAAFLVAVGLTYLQLPTNHHFCTLPIDF